MKRTSGSRILNRVREHYFIPPYVGQLGWIGVRLDRGLAWDKVAAVIEDAYLTAAPKRLPRFFATPSEFRAWLEKHQHKNRELWVGFYKKDSGKPSITWPESVDAALCFGWIDGIRKGIDRISYAIRFTPRKQDSTWSSVNVKRGRELDRLGLMRPAGLKAFEPRKKSGTYSYEQRHTAKLDASSERRFRANRKAWDFFQARPPWYRRTAIWWVISAKREETRQKRLVVLIRDSARGRTIPPLTRPT